MLTRAIRSVLVGLTVVACVTATQPAMGQVDERGEVDEGALADVDALQQRPVLLTTEAELQRAQQRSTDQSSPFYEAWQSVKADANAALSRQFIPQEPDDISQYYVDVNPESKAVHALAVAFRVTEDTAYLAKARDALMDWAVYSNADLPDDPTPSWRDFNYPGKAMPHAAGLHISRILVKFADAYAMLQPYLTANERSEIERWFASMRSPIQRSTQLWQTADWYMSSPTERQSAEPPWLNRQYYNNHLTAHVLGQLAIGYVTGNDTLVSYALSDTDNPRDLQELFLGVLLMPGDQLQERDPALGDNDERWPDPLPGEIYDRYRATNQSSPAGDRGLIYSALNQRFLALSAELVRNNNGSVDYWRYVSDSGESLRHSYATYSPYLSETMANATSCRGRYYEDSANTTNNQNNWRAMTDMAFREYPYDPAIRAVINTAGADRDYADVETFGHLAPLLDGELPDPPGGPELTYQSSSGSTPTNPMQIPASSGANQHFMGDWDGDGTDTPGWRIGNVFYLSNSPTGENPETYTYGRACEEAIVGDWNGNGTDTIGVRNGKKFLLSNDNIGPADVVYDAGRPGDRVVIGDWNGNGIDAPGLIRGKQMYLRTDNNSTPNYLPTFTFARVGDRFVAGDWDGDGVDTLAAVREESGSLEWFLRSGNSPNDPVASSVVHGDILDGALAGNVNGWSGDEVVAVRYR